MSNWQKLKDYLSGLVLVWIESKHTSFAGLVVFVAAVGKIFWPDHATQFIELRDFAMGYGLLMGGDALHKAKQNGTNSWSKAPESPKPQIETPKI